MGRIKRDVKRFREIGEDQRMDLKEFIKKGELGRDIKIPIKLIDLPKFEYGKRHKGGIGKGDKEEGDPVDDGDADMEDDQPGDPSDEEGDHEYYEMNPEEFAQELDDELGLHFDEKGEKVVEVAEGDFNQTRRAGPNSTLDTDYLFKQAIKRHAAMYADTEYVKEMLRVKGYGVEKVWDWSRSNNVNISKGQIQELNKMISNPTKYDSVDDIERELRRKPPRASYSNIQFRSDDERYRAPEMVEEPQHNAVVINIRDVSGSMQKTKKELVERIFTPMDWYLQGKYNNVEFVYIAHDKKAWEVNREEFFGITSSGGTQVSSAYELIKEEILSEYPWQSWNRFVFAAGDGENKSGDTEDNVVPLMKEISANRHAYVEVQPGNSRLRRAEVADTLERNLDDDEIYRVARVESKNEIMDAITKILDTTKGD